MRNIILGTGYLSGAASASAVSTASGYTAQNVVPLIRGTTYKAGGTSSQRLILDHGAAITPTFLGLANGNWSQWGTTKLQHSADGSAWTDFLTLSSLPSADSLYDYFASLTAAPARQWWALQWASATTAPELGVFYLGYGTTLTKNPAYGATEEDVDNVATELSEGRVVVAEEAARMLMRFDFDWPTERSTERDQIRDLIRTERGRLRPFWYVPADESGSSTAGRAYLVRKQSTSLAVRRRWIDTYALGLSLLEEV